MNLEQQDPTEKHHGDVGILVKYKYNNNNNNKVTAFYYPVKLINKNL